MCLIVNENINIQPAQTQAYMSLTVSDSVRVSQARVVADEELPFVVKVPNARSRAATDSPDQ